MIEYKIAKVITTTEGNPISKLEKEVNDLIKQGWALQGGVCMYPLGSSSGNRLFALVQTMVREKDLEDEIIKVSDPKVLSNFIEYCHKENNNE